MNSATVKKPARKPAVIPDCYAKALKNGWTFVRELPDYKAAVKKQQAARGSR